MRSIRVFLRQQYGQEVIHPADKTGELLAQLSGNKTITKPALALIKQLGYEVRVVNDVPKVL